MGSFCQNHIKSQPKKSRRFICHDTEEWYKIYGKTDLQFQVWHEKFCECLSNHLKVQKFYFDGLFLSKAYEVWAITLNSDAKFEKTLTLWFQKWHEELGELSLKHSKSEQLYIDGLFLSKVYNVSARKFHRNYVLRHWRVMQNLKENWLLAWKMI